MHFSDLAYHPYYNNDDDSDFYNTAQGFNYHQGPVSGACI